jgi:hypothetical protein
MFIDELKRRSISNMIDEAKEVDGNRKVQRYVTSQEKLMMSMDNETMAEENRPK